MSVVHVVDERVERADPLRQAALDRRPLGRGEHARNEIERPGAVTPLAVGARHLKRDPLLHEDRVPSLSSGLERLGSEPLQRRHQRHRVGQRPAVLTDQLVAAPRRDSVAGGERRGLDIGHDGEVYTV